MCEHCPETSGTHRRHAPPSMGSPEPSPRDPGRRAVLAGMLALPVVTAATATTGAPGAADLAAASGLRATLHAAAPLPQIVRRAQWGGDLEPKGPIPSEDVRFLLVHHTSEPGSNYQPGDVVGLLRGIYKFHTGPSKGWPDVAYNFFVDKFGTIYEGRTGSVDGPRRGSATGGNQGYSQLCCFIGDFNAAPPPPPALNSMYALLAWLADRYSVDTTPGATVQFTSLGSNRWPAGSTVRTATISGHRDVSQTECPGNACYALVRSTFPPEVSARRGAPATPGTPPTSAQPPPTSTAATVSTTTGAPPPPTTPPPTSSGDPSTTTRAPDSTTSSAAARTHGREIVDPPLDQHSSARWPLVAGVVVIGSAALAGATAVARHRTTRSTPTVDPASPSPSGSGSGSGSGWTSAPGSGSAVAWRVAGGVTDPLLDALATSAARAIGDEDWWDDLLDHWRVGPPAGVDAGPPHRSTAPVRSDSFLVASDGRRAVVRLTGGATGVTVLADGSTSELTTDGVTKVWLSTAAIRLCVDGETTEVTGDGVSGPVDCCLPART